MINSVLFQLDFQKFGRSERIELNPGLHVVYGESGCGKSKLIRCLAGIIGEEPVHFTLVEKDLPESVQIIFQNPENQILSHTLDSELAFGLECLSTDTKWLQYELKQLKSDLPFIENWDRHPASLSGGEMEMLNLVTALNTESELILIDDGLSFLDSTTKAQWVNWLRDKVLNGKTVLWFTSDMTDLTFGDTQWNLSLSGFELHNQRPSEGEYQYKTNGGELGLDMDNLCFSYADESSPLIQNWQCKISNARAVGLIGKNGKGKTTLSQLMTGFLQPESGNIKLHIKGLPVAAATLDQFPERMLGPDSMESFISELILHQKMNQRLLNKCINRLNSYQINWEMVKSQPALDIPWSTLRMALIIILAHCEYEILILDEPTFGLGWEQKLILSRFFQEILHQKHLILISHDSTFVYAHCDQIYDLDTQTVNHNASVLTHVT